MFLSGIWGQELVLELVKELVQELVKELVQELVQELVGLLVKELGVEVGLQWLLLPKNYLLLFHHLAVHWFLSPSIWPAHLRELHMCGIH
jgi:hypothetical protein